ncbi:MAG: ECF transporter S component [Clostridia bacterium]|nr:ECF transporter S component [Clostridia bacterium]
MNIEKRQTRIKKVAVNAMLCALSYASMLIIKIPVQFLDLDVKDSIIILSGLLFGPLSAAVISIVVPLIQLFTISGTGYYGFIMNVLSSLSFSLAASLIYKYKKSFSGAIVALASGVFAMTAVMMIANLIITPYYLGVPTEAVSALIPKLLLPFNLIKGVLNAAIVLLLYKPLSNVLKKMRITEPSCEEKNGTAHNKTISVIVMLCALALIAASAAVVYFLLMK